MNTGSKDKMGMPRMARWFCCLPHWTNTVRGCAVSRLLAAFLIALVCVVIGNPAQATGDSADRTHDGKQKKRGSPYKMVNGKPQKLIRTIASGADEILEMYEDENDNLELIRRSTHPALRSEFAIGNSANPAADGEIATCGSKCYERNFKAFDALLTKLEGSVNSTSKLQKIDDFYVSRVGVLIHEECFKKYGEKIEKWVTDATVQGMACHFDNYTIAKHFNQQSISYESHIPRLMNLFSSSQQVNEGAVFDMNGKPNIMTNPCEDYKSLPLAKDMRVSPNCKYVPEVKLGAPKVICQSDQFALAVSIHNRSGHLSGSNAYASGPHSKMPSYVNWNGKTKVYNYPVIGFVDSDRLLNEETFKAKFWHEIMHNCGYAHGDYAHGDEEPDRAYFCETACFGKAYGFNESKIDGARYQCEASDSNSSTFSELEDIKRRIISLSPSTAN